MVPPGRSSARSAERDASASSKKASKTLRSYLSLFGCCSPDQRVGRDREERFAVARRHRPQCNERAGQLRLEIRHRDETVEAAHVL